MDFNWLYVAVPLMLGIAAYLAKKNQRETGVSFWRSMFYSILLIIGLVALVLAAFSGQK